MQTINPIMYEELWTPITDKSVPNVADMYMVSTFGRVVSNSIHRHNQRLLTPIKTNNGYYRVNLRFKDGKCLYHLIHRIVMIEFCAVPNYQNLQVNHLDGNKANNAIWNLCWCTCSENITHAYLTGLKFAPNVLITNEQADMIGYLLSTTKMTHKEIAGYVGCSVSTVGNISSGNTWKHIGQKYNLESYKRQNNETCSFSDDELEKLFKYFEDHKDIKYKYKADLYRDALKELFNIDMNQNMTGTMSRLYKRQTRTNISDKYNF